MTIDKTHQWIDEICRKSQSAFKSPEQKDNALHRAQLGVFATYFAAVIQKQFIHVALNPFRKEAQGTADATGFVPYPASHTFTSNLHIHLYNNDTGKTSIKGTKIYKEDELSQALSSHIRPVNDKNPIAYFKDEGVQILPKAPNYGYTLFYLSEPVAPRYAYTMSGRKEVYDPATSVHLQWKEPYLNEVILRACEFLGMANLSPDVIQFANQKVQENHGTAVKI